MQHLTYLTLAMLAYRLSPQLEGCRVVSAFTQHKDELVLETDAPACPWLRVSCSNRIQYCVPVPQYGRARANSTRVLEPLAGQSVLAVQMAAQDRVIRIVFAGGCLDLCLFGSRSNIVWRPAAGEPLRFRGDVPLPAQPSAWVAARDIPAWLHGQQDMPPWLDKYSQRHLAATGIALPQYLAQVTEGRCCVGLIDEQPALCWMPHPQLEEMDLEEGLRRFLSLYWQQQDYATRYATVARKVQSRERLATARARQTTEALEALALARSPEEIGHLMMAQLHKMATPADEVELEDFYRGGMLTVKLDARLSAVENAQLWYARHKTRQREQAHLVQRLPQLETEARQAQACTADFAAVTRAEELRAFLKKWPQMGGSPVSQVQQAPDFRHFVCQGYDIYVGRNARNNDRLTQSFARKEDIWLHAREAQGSHVVVRRKDKQPVPPAVLEYAAGLAAWFSKQRGSGLVAVMYTPRKYVRKSRRMAPGQVIVERSQTLLVPPVDPQE
ncbi:MAG: DUF814 domain-containing protein [Bacteroidetes bacterium]|nr:DUF814 domain-containing protein [Bacteroidota bacterium]